MSETTSIEFVPDETKPANIVPPAEDREQPTERKMSAREEMMASIVARAEERRALEMAYHGEPDAEEEQRRADAEEAAARAALEAAPDATQATSPAAKAAPKPTPAPQPQTVVLDGIHYTPEQYAQLVRDGIAARHVIAQYNAQQQQVQRQAQAPQAPQAVPQAPPQQPSQPRGPILSEDEAKAISRGIVYGNEEENTRTVQRLADLVASRVPAAPQIDPNAIIHAAVQQTREQMEYQRNLETIGAEAPHIFSDVTLSQLAALKLSEIRQQDAAMGVKRSQLDSFREAIKRVDAVIPRPSPQPAPVDTAASQAARLQRKREAPSLPQAADRRATAPTERSFPTNSEIVERMRKARGQAAMR